MRDVRFHLAGHSFGCIVVSATLLGRPDGAVLRPVQSVALLQGALSHWSYCDDIPSARGQAGYFHRIVAEGRVRGPIVVTLSEWDSAVGRLYPIGAGAKRRVSFAPGELPKYGALGAFGARGPGLEIVDQEMLPADADYHFEPGCIYNLESSRFIRHGDGLSGAHSDIAGVEVAHAVWQAALA